MWTARGCLEHPIQLFAPPSRARPVKAVRDDAFVHLLPLRDDALRHARFKQRGLHFGRSQARAEAVDAGRQFGTGLAEYPSERTGLRTLLIVETPCECIDVQVVPRRMLKKGQEVFPCFRQVAHAVGGDDLA